MDKQFLLELEEYLEQHRINVLGDICEYIDTNYEIMEAPSFRRMACYTQAPLDLEEYIRKSKNEETFSTKLLKYIDQKELSDSEVYKKAGIDRRHFSKIRSNREYQPKKQTVIALGLALKLRLEQTEELLMLAGYSLSNSDTGDLVVKFCIEKGKYDLMEVNEALEYFGAKVIGTVES